MNPHSTAAALTPWVPIVFGVVASAHDLRTREIPDWISIALVCWAVLATALGLHDVTWLGMALGFAATFAVGALLFWLAGFGGGDVKLVAALGACYGLGAVLPLLFWIAIMGGVCALVAAARGKRDFAYAPAIVLGTLAFVVWQEVRVDLAAA